MSYMTDRCVSADCVLNQDIYSENAQSLNVSDVTKWGHYARECGQHAERVTDERSGQRNDGEGRESDQREEPNKETSNVMESTEDGSGSGEGEDKTKWSWRVENN